MNTAYKTVQDLSRAELDELRESYFDQPDSDEIFDGDIRNITDEILFQHYNGIVFVNDDFFCNSDDFHLLSPGRYTVTIELQANEDISEHTLDEKIADTIYHLGGEIINIGEYKEVK